MRPIGIFGGTFDPIHYGHLRTSFELLGALRLAEVRFIPCGDPPHRDRTGADAALRLRMVQAAISGQPGFVLDDRELRRNGPSYTVDTLAELRDEHPDRALCLLLGMDAFGDLPKWHRWEELLSYAHLVIAHRPGWRMPETGRLGRLARECLTETAEDLCRAIRGRIHIEAVTQLEISSTALRTSIASGADPKYLVPDNVRAIIEETSCYASDARQQANA
jgi:nicotinate-nucleotide adenylyltransferase